MEIALEIRANPQWQNIKSLQPNSKLTAKSKLIPSTVNQLKNGNPSGLDPRLRGDDGSAGPGIILQIQNLLQIQNHLW